jgi:hypothetical protein
VTSFIGWDHLPHCFAVIEDLHTVEDLPLRVVCWQEVIKSSGIAPFLYHRAIAVVEEDWNAKL